MSQAALGAKAENLEALLDLTLPLIEQVTQADGGHKSRMPDIHLKLMRDLIEIRNAASSTDIESIAQLDKKIVQMAALCRMWRHADGQFARFNGAGLMANEIIEETLARAEQSSKVLQLAPDSGFVRLSSARSTLIMDTGTPETNAAVTGFGTLAFEFAVGQHLLVVNPGQTATDANLQRLLCSTKAHSTLTIDGQNSSSPGENRLARVSNVEIGPAEGGMLAVATHDGYAPSTWDFASPTSFSGNWRRQFTRCRYSGIYRCARRDPAACDGAFSPAPTGYRGNCCAINGFC